MPLAAAQDFKRIGDDDTGPNTGGMGAYSPVPGVGAVGAAEICDVVHVPVLRELDRRGLHFTGCLYAGLMLTPDGAKVLEFNVRFGDPETQALVPRIEDDLAERLLDAACGRLRREAIRSRPAPASASCSRPGAIRRRASPASRSRAARRPRRPTPAAASRFPRRHRLARRPARHGRRARARRDGARRRPDDARARAYAAADHISFDGMQRRGISRAPPPRARRRRVVQRSGFSDTCCHRRHGGASR